jgi:O-antigen/teichoic acid export membrane protein
MAQAIVKSGLGFVVLQLAVVAISQMDLVIITTICGPAEATPYAVGVRVIGLGTLAFATYVAALWPAYGEAAARGDWRWVKQTHSRATKISTLGALLAGIAYVLLAPILIPLWAGAAAQSGRPLYVWIAATATIKVWTDAHAMLLNGLDQLRPQALSAVLHAIVSLLLALTLARYWGSTGVAAAAFLGYALVSAWALPLAVNKFLVGVAPKSA